MTEIQTPPTRSDTRDVFVVSTERARIEPEAFLRAWNGVPRGLWAHGRSWVAFSGATATVTASPGDSPTALRTAARCWRPVGPDSDAPLRFYGGLAFSPVLPTGDLWRPFGVGRFVLPAVELRSGSGPDRCRLIAHAAVETDLTAASRRAHQQLDAPITEAEANPVDGTAGSVGVQYEYEEWASGVSNALRAIDDGLLEKVVLARYQDIETHAGVDPVRVLTRIRRDNPHSTVFYFEPEPGHVFLGAAPEVLARVEGDAFATTAVAGSAARGTTPREDDRFAEALLGSRKERREHAIGVDDLRHRLLPLALAIEAEDEPHILRLARIQHLETHIAARLRPGTDILDVLTALHPTAAVCGHPRETARRFLAQHERFDRGWYAGPLGWFDGVGNGVFAPALRSVVTNGYRWRLFAGAGIVTGSSAEREWAETAIKLEPVLRALGTAPR